MSFLAWIRVGMDKSQILLLPEPSRNFLSRARGVGLKLHEGRLLDIRRKFIEKVLED